MTQGILSASGLFLGIGFFAGYLWRLEGILTILLSLSLLTGSLITLGQNHEEVLLVSALATGFIFGRWKGFIPGTIHFLGGVFSFIDRLAPERNRLTPEEEEILRQWHAQKKEEAYHRKAQESRRQRQQEEQAWQAREEAKRRQEQSERTKRESNQSQESEKQDYRQQYREERARSEEQDWKREQERQQQEKQEKEERQRQQEQKRENTQSEKVNNYLKILGLSGAYSEATLKNAYRKKRSEYHPDKHPNATEAEKKQFQELFNLVQDAYDYLKKR